jgi:DNA adenine methylase
MAVLLAKPRCQQETVCDLNGDLINLARVLADAVSGPALYRKLRRLPASEEIFNLACEPVPDDVGDMGRAAAYFIESWLGRNGLTGSRYKGNSFCVRYTNNGGSTATRWNSAVRSILEFRRRLRDVTILCRSAFEVLPNIADEDGTAIYADPPYLQKSKSYIHDFFTTDHGVLAKELCRFKRARVVVSYYDDPLLGDYYPGWTVRKLTRHKNMSNSGGGNGEKAAPEVLLLNGPSYAGGQQHFLSDEVI